MKQKLLLEASAQEILRRSLPFDSGTLSDDEVGAASSALFKALDRKDADSTPQ
jgi:hypothetical protein